MEKGSEREENRKARGREKVIKLKNGRVGKEIKLATTLYTRAVFKTNTHLRADLFFVLSNILQQSYKKFQALVFRLQHFPGSALLFSRDFKSFYHLNDGGLAYTADSFSFLFFKI